MVGGAIFVQIRAVFCLFSQVDVGVGMVFLLVVARVSGQGQGGSFRFFVSRASEVIRTVVGG